MIRVIVDLEGAGAIESYGPDDEGAVELYVSTNHTDLRLEIDPTNVDAWRALAAKILSTAELIDPTGLEVVLPAKDVRLAEPIDRTLPAGLRVSPTTEDDTEYARRRSG